ncbi:uncharacterized protein LOC124302873 [Neodiprion virginianus]|uniref:uncharacterized protein LOC124302873 n=1 Tax=Neodiprion virginianus TaxID=2961670 RepID=UPI001EE6E659|nr:uncharacterized protein LOC124302873 [Neodiprion virginianus]
MLGWFSVLVIFGVFITPSEGAQFSANWEKIFINHEDENLREYENLLLKIMKNAFSESKANVVLVSGECPRCNRILDILMKGTKLPLVAVTEFHLANSHNSSDTIYKFVTIVVSNFDELHRHFEKLRLQYAWNPRAKHLIVTAVEPSAKELQIFFEECWTHRVLNVGVSIYNRYEVYTYNRYLGNAPFEKVNASNLFYDKLRDMMGHPVRTKYVPFVGRNVPKWIPEERKFVFVDVDWAYAQAFLQTVNATAKYPDLSNEEVPLYAGFNYRFERWKQRNFFSNELWFNEKLANFIFFERTEQVYPLGFDGIYVIAPKSGLKLPNVFRPYQKMSWLAIGISLGAYGLYTYVLHKRRNITADAFMSTLATFLGQYYPKRYRQLGNKGPIIVWSLFSMLVISAYQGALYSALAILTYYPEVNTLDEVIRLTNTVYGYEEFYETVKDHMPPTIKLILLDQNTDWYKFMKLHPDYFYLGSLTAVKHGIMRPLLLSQQGIPLYHGVEQCFVPMYTTYFTPYGSPYLDKLDWVTLAFREAGLHQYWENQISINSLLTGLTVPFDGQIRTIKKLSLMTEILAFYIWAAGLLVSFCCFVYEVYSRRCTEKKS